MVIISFKKFEPISVGPAIKREPFMGSFLMAELIVVSIGVKFFLEKYAKTTCTKRTYETYESIFRINILPFLEAK